MNDVTTSALSGAELIDLLTKALAHAAAADASYASYLDANGDYEGEHVTAYSAAADATLAHLRSAVIARDVPRPWVATDETGTVEYELGLGSLQDARDGAREWAESCDGYDTTDGTVFLRYTIRCTETAEEHTVRIALQPTEPSCPGADDHDWQSPHAIVHGLECNPGVFGHGGGVLVREVCMNCGCERTTDTWATDRQTGEQGLTSVRYAPGKYADEIPLGESEVA